MDTNQCEPRAMEKHLDLHEAVLAMEAINDSLDCLTSRIKGPQESPVAENTKGKEPNLLEVLDGAPMVIRSITEGARSRIDAIEKLLF